MQKKTCVTLGTVLAAIAVVLGAFGAHALKVTLEEAGQLENWRTGVRYQMWHALALVAYGLHRGAASGDDSPGAWPAWCFVAGSLLFSGSIYCLCFGFLRPVMGPVTPLGGLLLICGWVGFALQAARGK